MEALAEKPKVCGNCGKVDAPLRCPCKVVNYCDEECQLASWGSHRGECSWSLERKLEKDRRRLGGDHFLVGQAAYRLGKLLCLQDRLSGAEEWLLEALRIARLDSGEEIEKVRFFTMAMLCDVYCRQGKLEEAVKMKDEALLVSPDGDESAAAAAGLASIGNVLLMQGLYDDAMKKYEMAHDMYCRLFGEDDYMVACALHLMVRVLDAQGKAAESLAMQEKELDIKRRALGPDHDALAASLEYLGLFYANQGMFGDALSKYEEGLSIVRRNHPERTALEGKILMGIGIVYNLQGNHEDALGMLKKALRIFRKTVGPYSPDAATARHQMARALSEQGKVDEATEMHEEALEILRRCLGTDHENVADFQLSMGLYKVKAGDEGGAVACFREAQGIFTKIGNSEKAGKCADALQVLRTNTSTITAIDISS